MMFNLTTEQEKKHKEDFYQKIENKILTKK